MYILIYCYDKVEHYNPNKSILNCFLEISNEVHAQGFRAVIDWVESKKENGFINKKEVKEFTELINKRNRVAHSEDETVSAEDLELAKKLLKLVM